ncbi:hypothetical protein HF521_004075, partial [Silurus meridionalis]
MAGLAFFPRPANRVPREEQTRRNFKGYKENAIEVRRGQFGLGLDAGYDQTHANAACSLVYEAQSTFVRRSGQRHLLNSANVNVGTMTGKEREIADMMERRKVDMYVQETKWKGIKARNIRGGFKLYSHGVEGKRNGVGVILKEENSKSVAEVKRVSDRVMLLCSTEKKMWWWNEEVQESIRRKRLAKQNWNRQSDEKSRQEYKEMWQQVKRDVAKAKEKAYEELFEKLDTKEGRRKERKKGFVVIGQAEGPTWE